MAAKVHKVIITNKSALKAKYGRGMSAVENAVKQLIAADKQRGLTTVLITIDSAATMKKYKGKAVTKPADPKQNKAAVDAVCKALAPDYLMILDSPDVIPHQDLTNPVPEDDPDRIVWSDLPYACQKGYSKNIENFIGPTRVVARLPGLTGAREPSYLVGLLQMASQYQTRPADEYAACLGISADVWKESTRLSLRNVFGMPVSLQLSPPDGPHWADDLLARRMHFINCHGAPADPHFYGQKGNSYPIAHDAAFLAGKVTEGSVAAVECCYGAELYDPGDAAGQMGICNTYLAAKAYGFFGSSTIAYGPASGNGEADLITQYFLKHVLEGASLGRAALQARQEYVLAAAPLGPVDLKTLAQFSLMSDPAIYAVQPEPVDHGFQPRGAKALASGAAEVAAFARPMRRADLLSMGLSLPKIIGTMETESQRKAPEKIMAVLRQAAREEGATDITVSSFDVRMPQAPGAKAMRALGSSPAARTPAAVHVAVGVIAEKRGAEEQGPPIRQIIAVVGRELDGDLFIRKLYSR